MATFARNTPFSIQRKNGQVRSSIATVQCVWHVKTHTTCTIMLFERGLWRSVIEPQFIQNCTAFCAVSGLSRPSIYMLYIFDTVYRCVEPHIDIRHILDTFSHSRCVFGSNRMDLDIALCAHTHTHTFLRTSSISKMDIAIGQSDTYTPIKIVYDNCHRSLKLRYAISRVSLFSVYLFYFLCSWHIRCRDTSMRRFDIAAE